MQSSLPLDDAPAPAARAAFSIFMLTVAAFSLLTTEFLLLGLLPPVARDLGVSIPVAGQLVTLYALAVTLCGPVLTPLLGHLNRKRLFIGIVLVFALSNLLAGLAQGFAFLAIARVISAMLLPVFWGTASESAAQLAGPGKGGKAVAQVYLGITAGFVFGIPLGTLAAEAVGWRGSFFILAGFCALVALAMAVFLPPLPDAPRHAQGGSPATVLKDPVFLLHVLLSVVIFSAMFVAYTYLADTLARVADIPSAQIGWWLMGFGLVGMIGNWLGGHLVDRSPIGTTLLLLALLSVGMSAVAPAAGHRAALVAALAVWGIAFTALFPVCQVRVMQAGMQAQALAGTLNVSAANAGIALGAALGGAAIQAWGIRSLGFAATALALLAIVLGVALSRRRS